MKIINLSCEVCGGKVNRVGNGLACPYCNQEWIIEKEEKEVITVREYVPVEGNSQKILAAKIQMEEIEKQILIAMQRQASINLNPLKNAPSPINIKSSHVFYFIYGCIGFFAISGLAAKINEMLFGFLFLLGILTLLVGVMILGIVCLSAPGMVTDYEKKYKNQQEHDRIWQEIKKLQDRHGELQYKILNHNF